MRRQQREKKAGRVFGLCMAAALALTSVPATVYADTVDAVIIEEVPGGQENLDQTVEVQVPGEQENSDQAAEVQPEAEQEDSDQAAEVQPEAEQESGDDSVWQMAQTQEGLEEAVRQGLLTFEENNTGIAVIAAKKSVKRADLLAIAQKQVGVSGRPNKYTKWFGKIPGYPSNGYAYAWCQAFASWVGYKAGIDVPKSASCWEAYTEFKEKGQWRSRTSGYIPRKGDYIYFDWYANGGWDHVGIVKNVKNGRVYTIEGNSGDKVRGDKSYALNDNEIVGYGAPDYADKGTLQSVPTGRFDELIGTEDGVRVRGWAFDWDNPDKALNIQIYVGGPAGVGTKKSTIVANVLRTDVNNTYRGAGTHHGYDATIKLSRKKDQTLYLYAVNISGGSGNTLLGSKTIKAGGAITSNAVTAEDVTVAEVSDPEVEVKAYNKVKASWTEVKNANGYQTQVTTDKNFKKSVETYGTKGAGKTIEVTCGKTYYFRVRAYRNVNGKKYYGKYTPVFSGKAVVAKPVFTSYTSIGKGIVQVRFNEVAAASGYQVVMAKNKSFTKGKKVYGVKRGGKTAHNLKSKTVYYVKVRGYRTVGGKKVYGPYSEVKSVETK